MAAEGLEGIMALVRHRAIGSEADARDMRADRMQMVEVVALKAALLAAAYIGWLSWSSQASKPASPAAAQKLLVQRDPETVAKARPAHSVTLWIYREDGGQHRSRRC